ncbi:MAG: hypothetical protein COT91_03195 [Candidatus Doudnabacteria bacterium CG10_big_fil_rev_8_21_14_0_10_41_10]|uniref:Glycosyltransferase RgtA/B/C/D-like domain-containing protein n=1 Tax=Candidatus Doudnabacteria bacterium CG10_big_fil_rev_8_21_14_0_10_41_10 TaxID=1974551 RepID=A0A2H0VDD2_9BACT|nr:MAG: hypothetical protein COT91_03195 [Candidatus Doudnabacteria bacterium CG10_big_fil_rev_8_21_14_0_10_41_10]
MSISKWRAILFLAIILVAIFFRFYALDRADVLTDEASVSFRAIGYLDFLATPYQTTPLEWMDERPWWSYLSFHDHPPLNFLIQFFTFKVFGISTFAMRLPAALFGLLSVGLLYLISRQLASEAIGFLAAGFLAVNSYHVWVSRVALQESASIFFVLLSFWVLLKAISKASPQPSPKRERRQGEAVNLVKKKYFCLFGLLAGMALLIKIHTIVIFPLAFLYLWFFRRDLFKQREIYISGLISIAVFSPYILYNIFLYKTFGHFDFQFSYLLGQDVAEWAARPGRFEFPTLGEKLKYFFINFKETLSPVFFWISGLSVVGTVVALWKKTFSRFLVSVLSLYFLFFTVLIGPSRRFLILMVPWLALLVAMVLIELLSRLGKLRKVFWVLIFGIFTAETVFAFNTNLSLKEPRKDGFQSIAIKQLAYPYGYNALDSVIDGILEEKKPAVVLPIANKNLSDFISEKTKRLKGEPFAAMFVYDPRFYGEAMLWALTRRMIYEGWPVMTYDVYKQALDNLGPDFFRDLEIEEFYYIAPGERIILQPNISAIVSDEELEQFENNLEKPRIINNSFDKEVFKIYNFK